MNTIENKTCTFCGEGIFKREIRNVEYRYNERIIMVMQPGFYCSFCNESVLEPEDLFFNSEYLKNMKLYF